MKKVIIISLISALPILAVAQENHQYIIDGKIIADTVSTGRIYMHYSDHGLSKRDSSEIKNNTYHFEGSMIDGAIVTSLFWYETHNNIRVLKPFKGFVQFYSSPGHITLVHKKSFSNAEIKGSSVQSDVEVINQLVKAKTKPKEMIEKDYIKTHPKSWLSFVFLEEIVRSKKISFEEGSNLYAGLDAALKKYEQVQGIQAVLSSYQTVGLGKPAPDFTANDVNGKPVSLSSFKGKHILVDFWASWCHPCRAENPVMVEAYKKYSGKGFDILGVSLDADKKHWVDAIKQDGVAWGQVSNLKAFGDGIALQYGITAIPRNFLISPDGKIVAMDLRGEELDEKLKEIFK